MPYYFAPLEGLTDRIYRQLHEKYFGGVDRYYTPFFSPTVHRALTPREERELAPASSMRTVVIPQLLTKNSQDFLWFTRQCADRGYREVNLNLGCPSGTVTAKGKGAGMLADPQALDRFFEEIFSASVLPVSVKTRLGIAQAEEFSTLMQVFNRYPIRELIVHPRIRKDFYQDPVRMTWFDYALRNSRAPVCYNGDICSVSQLRALEEAYPGLSGVMIGRAFIADPGMLLPQGTTVPALEAFHEELLESYLVAFNGSRNAMFRLKENWRYLLCLFEPCPALAKQLRKTTDLAAFRSITTQILHSVPLRRQIHPDW